MAKRATLEDNFSADLHVRMKVTERNALQQRAQTYGMTLSQAARKIIIQQLSGEGGGGLTPTEAHLQTLQAIQTTKVTFKKIAVDIGRYVASYENAINATNKNGDLVISTELTLRTSASIVKKLIDIQGALNQVIKTMGVTEVHVAAKPSVDSVIGKYLSGETNDTADGQGEPNANALPKSLVDNNQIPIEFSSDMFTASLDGVLIADCETYTEGNYEKIRLLVQVNLYRNRRTQTYTLDAIDFASRYKNVIPHLKKDKKVVLSGEFDFTTGTYNGVSSESNATIEIKTLTLL